MKKISDAEKKRFEESDRLIAAFKVYRDEWFTTTLQSCPDEMIRILRYVRDMPISAEDDFLERIQKLEWLMQGHPDIRFMLLRVIAKRMDQLYGVLNDPMPPETNMFFKARQILGVR